MALHSPSALLRPWRLRARRRLLTLLLIDLLQRIQHAARGGWRNRRSAADRLRLGGRRGAKDRTRLAVVARIPGQEQASQEEAERQDARGPGQEIGGAAAR